MGNCVSSFKISSCKTILFALFLAAAVFFQPQLAAFINFPEVVGQFSYSLAMSAGMACIMLGGGFDFSVGGQMALTVMVFNICMDWSGNTLLAVSLSLAAGLACGALNGTAVAALKIPSYIATLATQLIFQGIVETDAVHYDRLAYGTYGGMLPLWTNMVFILILVLAVDVVLTRTYFGRYVRAMGEDEGTLANMGVRVRWVKMACYLLGGGLFAVAAITSRWNQDMKYSAGNFSLTAEAMLVFYFSGISRRRAGLKCFEVFPRLLAGTFVLEVLKNLMNLWGLEAMTADILIGSLLLAAFAVIGFGKRKRIC